jgi:AcrR family transcriptional regulator
MAVQHDRRGPGKNPARRRQRVPIDERRQTVLDSALIEFGRHGFDGTSTSVIASRAGIQQPYIYAIFENKRELFLACLNELNQRLLTSLRKAAGDDGSAAERLDRIAAEYRRLMRDEDWTRFHLQALAAGGHAELRRNIREGFEDLFAGVGEISGATEPEVARLFADGMLASAMTTIGEPDEAMELLGVSGNR